MTNNNKNYKELENEKTRGRKRYLERVQEEQEAKNEIQEYDRFKNYDVVPVFVIEENENNDLRKE